MAFICAGTVVGLSENPYEFDGRVGVSRVLSVTDGRDVEEIKLSQTVVDELGPDNLDKLRQLGRPVVCRVSFRVQEREGRSARGQVGLTDIDFVRLADLARFGYDAGSVYVEDEDTDTAGTFGGAL